VQLIERCFASPWRLTQTPYSAECKPNAFLATGASQVTTVIFLC